MRDRRGDPLAAVRNLASKAWRHAAAVPKRGVRLARRASRLREQASAFQAEWQIERDIAAVARGRQPIIAGPWLSEVGFEVLYWIPFLRWFEDRYRVDRERVIAVSRGGVADWYRDVSGGYVEIFDHVDPETFSRRNAERREGHEQGGQKQTLPSSLDRDVIAAVRRRSGAEDAVVCHPALMYRLFSQFWLGHRALDLVMSHTRYAPPTMTPRADLGLPEEYIAAKFYTGAALPDTSEYRCALREIVRVLAQRLPVVTLDTGMATDEHEDYLFRDVPNVISLRGKLEPRTNLGVQASVIAGAQHFVGTCGSVAWMAPMLGVDTIGVYAEERFLVSHIAFASQVYRQMGAARFDTLDLHAVVQSDVLASPSAAESVRR
ncbi:MAG: hypothetical protein EXQ53_06845 [Acidobacteria bacterium]|nr:hypothetical protein [Acidobacteriota bacterium]